MSLYYEDEFVELHHGDCRAIRGWTRAQVLVTDPPYGVGWVSGAVGASRARRKDANALRSAGEFSVKGDDSTDMRDAALDLWGDKPALVFGSWRQPRPEGTRHRLIWHKAKTFAGVRTQPWFPADEEIYVLGSGWLGKPEANVYTTQRMLGASHGLVAEIGHPTPKPVGLMEQLIAKAPPRCDRGPFRWLWGHTDRGPQSRPEGDRCGA